MDYEEVKICGQTLSDCTPIDDYNFALSSNSIQTCFSLQVSDDAVFETSQDFSLGLNATHDHLRTNNLAVEVLDNECT